MHACCKDLMTDRYASDRLVYLPECGGTISRQIQSSGYLPGSGSTSNVQIHVVCAMLRCMKLLKDPKRLAIYRRSTPKPCPKEVCTASRTTPPHPSNKSSWNPHPSTHQLAVRYVACPPPTDQPTRPGCSSGYSSRTAPPQPTGSRPLTPTPTN